MSQRKFVLLKDLPTVKAGKSFIQGRSDLYSDENEDIFLEPSWVENNPTWFMEITNADISKEKLDFEWMKVREEYFSAGREKNPDGGYLYTDVGHYMTSKYNQQIVPANG